jgi:hypothetical protein
MNVITATATTATNISLSLMEEEKHKECSKPIKRFDIDMTTSNTNIKFHND